MLGILSLYCGVSMATEINPKRYDLSASSIASFKSCPVRFKLAYREGLRLAEDTDSQRMGTNWHSLHEVYHVALGRFQLDSGGEGTASEFALAAAIAHLNERYAKMPASKTPEAWALERQQLLVSFIGYLWFYQEDPIEVLASEVPFELPLYEPKTGMPLPLTEVRRIGKMDHIIRWQGMVGTLERKSTSRGIDADSDYWDKAKKDTQVSMYALAFREMKSIPYPGEGFINLTVGNTLYDVWHKPTIKPAWLSQKDTAAFLESNEYMGQKFHVVAEVNPDDFTQAVAVVVNDQPTEVDQGKKGFAIRETIDMYGARLLADIQERPGFYFQRREIARTDKDLAAFKRQLFAVYQTQKLMEKHNTWYEDESACRATFPCQYIPICFNQGHEQVSANRETPNGFRRIFVDLTINGQNQEE